MSNKLTEVDSVAGCSIWVVDGEPNAFVYRSGLAVDCDGSPRAYGPNNSGLDYTANGGNDTSGKEGAWWGGPVDGHGKPVVQKIYEPQPGLYVSGTSLVNPAYPVSCQYRYTDAEAIPFIVLPGSHSNGAKVGDVVFCLNTRTNDNCYGIYADVGPGNSIGEASVRMAQALNIYSDPRAGGTESKIIVYLVFPGSVGAWKPAPVWWDAAQTISKAWGGLDRLKEIAKSI